MNDGATNEISLAATMLHEARTPLVMARGQGSWIWDVQGRRYLDFMQGWAVNALGHSHASVVTAIADQAARLTNCGPGFFNEPAATLCTRLATLSQLHGQAFLCSSGAEANEGAIKLARKWAERKRPGAFEIISTTGSFHGRTLATMACSGKPGWDNMFPPAVPGFVKVPYGDVAAAAAAVNANTAAIIVEPIQGEAGVVVPPVGYLRGLRKLANAYGVLLVFDEVQTGVGRTGTLFSFEREDTRPDILTLGKGLGGGLPLAAMLAVPSACVFQPGEQGGTFSGNPVLAAAAHAVLDEVAQPEFLANVTRLGQRLADGLLEVAKPVPQAQVRGRGLLLALVLPGVDTQMVARAAHSAGLLVHAPQPHVLRFMPALNVTDREVDLALEILRPLLACH